MLQSAAPEYRTAPQRAWRALRTKVVVFQTLLAESSTPSNSRKVRSHVGTGGAARARAAQRFTTDDKLALLAAHEPCANSANSEDKDRYYYDNEQFHKVIYAASHWGFLAEQCLMLHICLRP